MAIKSLQMQQNLNMNIHQHHPNLTFYEPPYFSDNNATQFNDPDAFDDTIEGAATDNFSDLYCPSFSYQNVTYLNVSCDTALDFSVPLYGECSCLEITWKCNWFLF